MLPYNLDLLIIGGESYYYNNNDNKKEVKKKTHFRFFKMIKCEILILLWRFHNRHWKSCKHKNKALKKYRNKLYKSI